MLSRFITTNLIIAKNFIQMNKSHINPEKLNAVPGQLYIHHYTYIYDWLICYLD